MDQVSEIVNANPKLWVDNTNYKSFSPWANKTYKPSPACKKKWPFKIKKKGSIQLNLCTNTASIWV